MFFKRCMNSGSVINVSSVWGAKLLRTQKKGGWKALMGAKCYINQRGEENFTKYMRMLSTPSQQVIIDKSLRYSVVEARLKLFTSLQDKRIARQAVLNLNFSTLVIASPGCFLNAFNVTILEPLRSYRFIDAFHQSFLRTVLRSCIYQPKKTINMVDFQHSGRKVCLKKAFLNRFRCLIEQAEPRWRNVEAVGSREYVQQYNQNS